MNNLGLGYEQLNLDEKNAYLILLHAVQKQQISCDISKIKRNINLMKVLNTVLSDNPNIIYFNKGLLQIRERVFSKQLNFLEYLSKKQALQINQELEKKLRDAAWEIDKNARNDRDILKGISEFLQRTANYDYEELKYSMSGKSKNFLSHNAYGALVNHKAVCDGFSSAYSLLAQYFGFKCMIVNGKSSYRSNSQVEHAWNIVEYNGNFYHIDSTWDVNTYEAIKEYSYDYFGLDDDEILLDHVWDYKSTPKCSVNELSYFVANDLFAKSESQIEDIIYRQIKHKEKVIRVKISLRISLGDKPEEYIKNLIRNIMSRSGIYTSFTYVWQENTRCLTIKI